MDGTAAGVGHISCAQWDKGQVMANPFTVVSTATRHMLDANVTFGMSSDRYNARDKYRRTYSDSQRLGAGIGTGLGVALPVAAGIAWAQRGLRVPGVPVGAAANMNLAAKLGTSAAVGVAFGAGGRLVAGMFTEDERIKNGVGIAAGGMGAVGTFVAARAGSHAAMQLVGRGIGVAALGVAAGVAAKKTAEIAKDDGHMAAPLAAAGVLVGAVAGAAVGNRFGGRIAAVSGGIGAVVGGVAGHFGGKAWRIGESQIGKEFAQAPQVDKGVGDRVGSFARGAINHFNEVGPATQGISFGYQWGMRDTVQKQYSNAERAGGMHGDLAAAGILGGGALAVVAGLTGNTKHAAQGISGLKAAGDIAGGVLGKSSITAASHAMSNAGSLLEGAKLPFMNKVMSGGTAQTIALGAAAATIAGVAGWKAFESDKENWGTAAAATIGVATLAATAGTAAVISKVAQFSAGTSPVAKAASSALVAAALIGVVSAARLPLQQFMNDAKDAHAANKGTISKPVMIGSTAIGAAAGLTGALAGLNKIVPDGGIQLGKWRIPKLAVVLTGGALGLGAGGGIGLGLSGTMPGLGTTAASVGVGAVAGAAAGLAFRGMPTLPGVGGLAGRVAVGAIGGAALGLSASSLLRQDTPAKPSETTPQEAAGTVGG